MKKNDEKTNIFVKIFLIVVILGLAVGAIFLGKYLAELNLERNNNQNNVVEQDTNVSLPLEIE